MSGNFGAKILNNAVSALSAQQAIIANAGNNIANVNTPGYTRRAVDLQTRSGQRDSSGISIGNGVEITGIRRYADAFMERQLREAVFDKEKYGIEDELLARVDQMFSLVTEDGGGIGGAMTSLFSAVNDLRADPSSIELRSDVLERAEDLVTSIRSTYGSLADLQSEIDQRIVTEVETVNSLTAQIADLNVQISAFESGGSQTAADQRDQRDKLMQDLSEKISFNVVEGSDGMVKISLANGFPLVSGPNSRALSTTNSPSFLTGDAPESLGGGVLNYITYDYSDAGTAHLDLTKEIANGGGSLAGLLAIRGVHNNNSNDSAFQAEGVLPELAARVEAITRQLLTTFNAVYRGPGPAANIENSTNLAGDLDGNSPAVFGFFNFAGSVDDDADGIADLGDLVAVSDTIDNFSSLLELAIDNPRKIAAAFDVNAGVGAASYPKGDGQNLEAIAALESRQLVFSIGTNSVKGTFGEAYNELVTYVGNTKSRSSVNASVAADSYITASNQRDQFSAVNLDEEFTTLIRAQQAYQASAKMIRTADQLFEQLMSLL